MFLSKVLPKYYAQDCYFQEPDQIDKESDGRDKITVRYDFAQKTEAATRGIL